MELKEKVREKYGEAALRVTTGGSTCCGSAPSSGGSCDPITSNLYDSSETSQIPKEAFLASLGCGNPTALAKLNPGESVLDLGSGGGIDVLLSAKRVGPTGKAYGLDMTDEMLALARENQRKAGVENVEFLKGEIEHIPLPDNSVDVIISNCVINLSADKDRVLREALRVLKPGGRFAVSDVVVRGVVPAEVRRSMELWVGCIAGALEDTSSEEALAQFQTNFFGNHRVCRCALPHLRARERAHIVVIGSVAGLIAVPFQGMYSAAKFALEGYCEALRMELRGSSVRIAIVEPGDFATGFTAARQETIGSGQGSAYRATFEAALAVIKKDETGGADPVLVSRVVKRIIETDRPALRHPVGAFLQTAVARAKPFLPAAAFETLIADHYKCK